MSKDVNFAQQTKAVEKWPDLEQVTDPLISVVTPSLNHAHFLHDTIRSVANQSFRNLEHIVIDGGSTDETCDILAQYPHLRWISEKEGHIVEAYQKGFAMARGKYIIQCCVSDGFLDQDWFQRCFDVLEANQDVSLVWGIPQYMSEDGRLLGTSFPHFFEAPPPQKEAFLPFWLATGFLYPEGNYCVRSKVIRDLYPKPGDATHFVTLSHNGFARKFVEDGYLSAFIPAVANYGRLHADQRGRRLASVEGPAHHQHVRDRRRFALRLVFGNRIAFKNGQGELTGTKSPTGFALGINLLGHWIGQSMFMRTPPRTLFRKIVGRLSGR
jgi:glycosyltransferase involved in cell wall biosynthesis